jgi:3-keto-5-aminohexanoate cleavage enzyme
MPTASTLSERPTSASAAATSPSASKTGTAAAVTPGSSSPRETSIFLAAAMEADGRIAAPLHMQIVLGIRNAMPVDRRVFEFYAETLARLSPHATFTGAGIGRDALTVARWAMELGGHVRTGMEDNVRLDRHTLAPSNAALVEQVAAAMPAYGRRPATVQGARRLLGLPPSHDAWPARSAPC